MKNIRSLVALATVLGCADDPVAAPGVNPPSVRGSLIPAFISTIGGSDFEHSRDVVTDAAGNLYVTGGTQSPDFPIAGPVFQTSHNPGAPDAGVFPFDAFISKLDPQGTLIWSTYLGGRNYDRAYAIELDGQGFIYVAGRAGSGFPVTPGAFQTTFSSGTPAAPFYGLQDGFVCKIKPDGTAIVFCSYFGGSDNSIIRDIDIDPVGDIYVASGFNHDFSGGSVLPITITQALTNTPMGGHEGFVAKIKSDGSRVLWARFIGGSGDESNINTVRVDATGRAYFLTSGTSRDVYTSPGALQRTAAGPVDAIDLYLVKLAPDGKSLDFATYFGGSGTEALETHNLEIDSQGNAYLAASTTSADFMTTANAFQRVYAGGVAGSNYPGDAFVAKISSDGSTLLASTMLGGPGGDGAEGIALDGQGNVYITGAAGSTNFPTTSGAYSRSGKGGTDVFVAKFSPDLSQLLFSTLIGGSLDDTGRAATLDANGNFYVVGQINSSNYPRLNSLAQSAFGGGRADALILKFKP
ncbi:MAG: SBBP repeat-containing protein [Gemmatimonadaceae bacterium]